MFLFFLTKGAKMSKKRKISYLREMIMCDIEKVKLLLKIITFDKVESLKEAQILANLALLKSKQIDRNNEKIGKILGC